MINWVWVYIFVLSHKKNSKFTGIIITYTHGTYPGRKFVYILR
jgi:hypothetical protein